MPDEDESCVKRCKNRIYFMGTVSTDSAGDLIEKLEECSKYSKIHIHINSTGGDLQAAFAVCAWILRSEKQVWTHADSYVASAAMCIFVCGNQRFCNQFSIFLIHSLSFATEGKLFTIKDDVREACICQKKMASLIKRRTKIPPAKLKKMFKKDISFGSKLALRWEVATSK